MLRASQALIAGGILHRDGYKLTLSHRKARSDGLQGIQGTVYIVACPLNNPFVHTVRKLLTKQGINYRLIDVPWSECRLLPQKLTKWCREKPIGIILRASTITESLGLWLEGATLPIVVYAEGLHPKQACVQMDVHQAVERGINHLYELGHRRMAIFSIGPHFSTAEWIGLYRTACLKRGLKESASNLWVAENYREDVVREALTNAHRLQPEVTALMARDHLAVRATRIFSVPKDISVIGVGEATYGMASHPPVTMVALRDPDVLAAWACTNLIDQIQTIQSGMPPKIPTEALFVPELIQRNSTREITTTKVATKLQVKSPIPVVHPSQTWRKVYPFLQKKSWDEWRPLDISKLVNHSMTRYHGWLGTDPLEYFPPGLRSIHGVPFQVLNEEHNRGYAVITFRSPRSHSAEGKKLPTQVRLPVKLQTKALYFLHGCGYAIPIPFAEYIIHFASGRQSTVPLVPLGLTKGNPPKFQKHMQPNVQDWWEGYEQRDFPHAHRATVFNVVDPTAYERTLYSLEWINPRPNDEVSSLEVRVDPKAGPILALISVTALL